MRRQAGHIQGATRVLAPSGRPVETSVLVEFGAAVASALAQWHDREGVHGALSAEALVVEQLGAAHLFRLVHPDPLPANDYRYRAPEQTGRLSRGIDERTDLYALGAMLYELATGEAPFPAENRFEHAHRQLTGEPARLRDSAPELPAVVDDIVLQLLQTLPEDRYQTARGLAEDLARCADELAGSGVIAPFLLAGRDVRGHVLPSGRLYGRQARLTRLTQAYERVATGGGVELHLVTAEVGLGKTALLAEFANRVILGGGRVARAGFVGDDATPWAAVGRLLTDLVEQLLMESDGQVSAWRDRLTDALGASAGVLVDVVPALARLLGGQPAPPPGGGGEFARNRLHLAVRRLLSALGAPGRPMVLVVDDLHWSDAVNVDLLRYLLDDPESQHLLVVGAYRSKQAVSPHPLAELLKERNAYRSNVSTALRPLPDTAVGELLAETLRAELRESQLFARVVVDKTGSNPLAIGEFLLRLREERVLVYDDTGPSWHWDLDGVHTTPTLSFTETLDARIDRLPDDLVELLALCAVLGDDFDLAELSLVTGRAPADLCGQLRYAVQERLLVPTGGPRDGVGITGYRWVHTVARQAMLTGLTEADRGELGLVVGRALLAGAAQAGEGAGSPAHQAAAGQLNTAIGLIASAAERIHLAELDLAVGVRALRLGATAAARDLLLTAFDLVAAADVTPAPRLSYAVHVEAARALCAAGDCDHAQALARRAVRFATDDVDRARLLGLTARCRCAAGAFDAALEPARQALELLGVELPGDAQQWPASARSAVERLGSRLAGVPVDDLVRTPSTADPRATLASEILADLLSASVFPPVPAVVPTRRRTPRKARSQPAGDPGRHVTTLLAATGVELALDHGLTRCAAVLFAAYATAVATGVGHGVQAEQCAYVALRLDSSAPAPEYAGRVTAVVGFVRALWADPAVEPLTLLRQASMAAVEHGDLRRAADNRVLLAAHSFATGAGLESVRTEIEQAWRLIERQPGGELVRAVVSVLDDAVSRLHGQPGVVAATSPAEVAHVLAGTAGYASTVALACMVEMAYVSGDHSRALELARSVPETTIGAGHGWGSFLAATTDFYQALALVTRYAGTDPRERETILAELAVRQAVLDNWAAHAPVAFGAQALLLSAQRARLDGDPQTATVRFGRAIDAAREHCAVPVEAIAAEIGGRYALTRGDTSQVVAYLRRARACYDRWGALVKVGQIDRMLADVAAPAETERQLDQLDLLGVVRVFQAISAELGLDRLVVTLLTLLVQHARADRGALMLSGPLGLRLVAVATADRGQITVVPEPVGRAADEVPMTVVAEVGRHRHVISGEPDGLPGDLPADPYLVASRPRSVLCAPIVRLDKLMGVLYLEHRRLSAPFTPEYLDVLEVLCAQAAIAVENATAHARLLEANRILDATFDGLPVGLILLGPDLTVRRASPRAMQITGLPIRAGTPLMDLLDVLTPTGEADNPYRREPRFALVAGGVEPIRCNLPVRSSDGRRRWLQTTAIPLRADDGELVGVTVLVADLN